jgi:hypothetical protein
MAYIMPANPVIFMVFLLFYYMHSNLYLFTVELMMKKSLFSMGFLLVIGKACDTMVTQEKQGVALLWQLLVK